MTFIYYEKVLKSIMYGLIQRFSARGPTKESQNHSSVKVFSQIDPQKKHNTV